MLWATTLKWSCWWVNNQAANFCAVSAPENVTSLKPHVPGQGPLSSLSHKPILSQSSQRVTHSQHTDFGFRGLSIHFGQTVWATTKLGRCVGLPHHDVLQFWHFEQGLHTCWDWQSLQFSLLVGTYPSSHSALSSWLHSKSKNINLGINSSLGGMDLK